MMTSYIRTPSNDFKHMAFANSICVPLFRPSKTPLTHRALTKPKTTKTKLRPTNSLPHRNCKLRASEDVPTESNNASDASPMPDSFDSACDEARCAVTAALASGKRRLFVELDTTNGDATYTTLKTTTPTALALSQVFGSSPLQIVFPDAGAAALARRDWSDAVPDTVRVVGLEQYERKGETEEQDAVVILVVPRASEVDKLAALVKEAGNIPVLMVNPDLVDMGVTGLSLNARKLRAEVIDSFDSVYFLRVYAWGVLFRRFPDKWQVWVDDAKMSSGFRCIASLEKRPNSDEIEELLDENMSTSGEEGQLQPNAIQKALKGFRRFLDVYTKG